MNDRQRKLFVNVVDAGSFSKAAQEAFVTPQSVSQQIRNLEKELGVTLLERSPQGILPTQAGRTFYDGCKRLEREADDLVELCRELGAPARETIKIGLCYDHSLALLTQFLPEYLHRFPKTDVEYVEVSHANMLEGLRADAFDVTESIRPDGFPDTDDIGFTPLKSEGRCCLVSTKNPLARKTVVEPEDLIDQHVYVFSLQWATSLQHYLQGRCPEVHLLEAPPASHCLPQRLCEAGDAVYLLPSHMRDRFEPLVPVEFPAEVTCDYGLVYLASKKDWLQGFLDTAADVVADATAPEE